MAPTIAPQSYQNQPYYPFNLENLNIDPPRPPLRRRLLLRHHLRRPPFGLPAAPTGVTAVEAGTNQIALSWNASASADHYMVERSVPVRTGRSWLRVCDSVLCGCGALYSTSYSYCVVAVAASGASAQLSRDRPDGTAARLLSAGVASLTLRRVSCFPDRLPVSRMPTRRRAIPVRGHDQLGRRPLEPGDGHGGAGSFVVDASHSYAKNGHSRQRDRHDGRPGFGRRERLGHRCRGQPAQASPACPGHSSRGQEAREAGEKAAQVKHSPASGS